MVVQSLSRSIGERKCCRRANDGRLDLPDLLKDEEMGDVGFAAAMLADTILRQSMASKLHSSLQAAGIRLRGS